MKRIKLSLKKRSYEVLIGRRLIKNCGLFLKKLKPGKDAIIITNATLRRLYGKTLAVSLKDSGFTVRVETVPDSERAKSIKVLSDITARISSYDKHRQVFIVAFGGGVVGDLAGFIAATYKRGVPYVQIPTTLLAQVDSAIGGKVAVDLPIAKNMLGAFYQPRLVLSDVSLIESLSASQVRNGLAEIIKYGVIKDRRLFEYLEANYRKILKRDMGALEFVISRSSAIKADVVARDEFDNKGLRVILNYGHTIGHAIEAAAGFTKRFYHGEAIAIGMVAAARISLKLGLISKLESDRIESLIKKVGLPVRIGGLELHKIYDAHLHDKKFINRKNRFVLPARIGAVRVVEAVPDTVVKGVIKTLSGDV